MEILIAVATYGTGALASLCERLSGVRFYPDSITAPVGWPIVISRD